MTLRFLLFVVPCVGFLLVGGAPASAQTETLLFSFPVPTGDSQGGLAFDETGNLYGTTVLGGAYGYGTVFQLSPVSDGGWTGKVLHSFSNDGRDGVSPYSGLVFDNQGSLYGATYYGGMGTCSGGQYPGCGTIFQFSLSSGYRVIHSFRAGSDGAYPAASLTLDSKGNLYGTTASGGPGGCRGGGYIGCGTVFALTKRNGRWIEKVLYAFNGSDGEFPYGPVTFDAANNLYGTAEEGGTSCPGGFTCGVVFELSRSHGVISEKTLHNFRGGTDGQFPVGNMVFDAAGNLYGATLEGGGNCGCGTVFELSSESEVGWSERVIYRFFGRDGAMPSSGLVKDSADYLYGTTAFGGGDGGGTVFKLDTTGNETVLHSFAGSLNGFEPSAGLVLDATDNLYGTTAYGGSSGHGVVFELTP